MTKAKTSEEKEIEQLSEENKKLKADIQTLQVQIQALTAAQQEWQKRATHWENVAAGIRDAKIRL